MPPSTPTPARPDRRFGSAIVRIGSCLARFETVRDGEQDVDRVHRANYEKKVDLPRRWSYATGTRGHRVRGPGQPWPRF